MKSLFSLGLLVGTLASTWGCSSVEASKLPGGGYRIQCEKGMSDCVARADTLCKGKGYTILSGQNATHHIGGPSSSYQGVLFVGDLEVACGKVALTEPVCKVAAPTPPSSAVEPQPSVPSGRACVPGASQACVGPAGCSGGQVCAPDGSAFGSCDCGAASSTSTSAAPPQSPAAPAGPARSPAAAPSVPGAMPAPDALGTRN